MKRVKITQEFIKAFGRKRGELNVSWSDMSDIVGINRYTLRKIMNGSQKVVNANTAKKLNDWLYRQV